MALHECGSSNLDWENQKVTIIQAFWGPNEAGHFATLILDNTDSECPLAVCADSLPNCQRNAMVILQDLLKPTPLVFEKTTWIQADIPKQGGGPTTVAFLQLAFLFFVFNIWLGMDILERPHHPDWE